MSRPKATRAAQPVEPFSHLRFWPLLARGHYGDGNTDGTAYARAFLAELAHKPFHGGTLQLIALGWAERMAATTEAEQDALRGQLVAFMMEVELAAREGVKAAARVRSLRR